MFRVGVRTAPSVITSMSQGSSNPASPSRPVLAPELQETITLVSPVFSLRSVRLSRGAQHRGREKTKCGAPCTN